MVCTRSGVGTVKTLAPFRRQSTSVVRLVQKYLNIIVKSKQTHYIHLSQQLGWEGFPPRPKDSYYDSLDPIVCHWTKRFAIGFLVVVLSDVLAQIRRHLSPLVVVCYSRSGFNLFCRVFTVRHHYTPRIPELGRVRRFTIGGYGRWQPGG